MNMKTRTNKGKGGTKSVGAMKGKKTTKYTGAMAPKKKGKGGY